MTSQPSESRLGDLGYEYFMAMMDASLQVRVIATNMAAMHSRRSVCEDCSNLDDPNPDCPRCNGTGTILHPSRWAPFSEEFMRPVPKHYINVVCGSNGELARLFTLGAKNVAIASAREGAPSKNEVAALKEYNSVICPHESDAEVFRLTGVSSALHVAPSSIASILKGFL